MLDRLTSLLLDLTAYIDRDVWRRAKHVYFTSAVFLKGSVAAFIFEDTNDGWRPARYI